MFPLSSKLLYCHILLSIFLSPPPLTHLSLPLLRTFYIVSLLLICFEIQCFGPALFTQLIDSILKIMERNFVIQNDLLFEFLKSGTFLEQMG